MAVNYERYVEQRISVLSQMYSEVEKKIILAINSAETFTPSELEEIRVRVAQTLKDLNDDAIKYTKEQLRREYKTGARDGVNFLNAADQGITYSLDKLDLEAIDYILNESKQFLGDGIRGIDKSVGRILDKAAQERIKFKFVEGRLDKPTLKKISDLVAGELRKGFVAIQDKAGREWSLEHYSNTVVRTKMVESANMGMMNQLTKNGFDLVQVTSHNSLHKECKVWEGEILSITGNTKGYKTVDQAKEQGLFHPNCKHRLVPYHQEFAEQSQTWSNGFYKSPPKTQ